MLPPSECRPPPHMPIRVICRSHSSTPLQQITAQAHRKWLNGERKGIFNEAWVNSQSTCVPWFCSSLAHHFDFGLQRCLLFFKMLLIKSKPLAFWWKYAYLDSFFQTVFGWPKVCRAVFLTFLSIYWTATALRWVYILKSVGGNGLSSWNQEFSII